MSWHFSEPVAVMDFEHFTYSLSNLNFPHTHGATLRETSTSDPSSLILAGLATFLSFPMLASVRFGRCGVNEWRESNVYSTAGVTVLRLESLFLSFECR